MKSYIKKNIAFLILGLLSMNVAHADPVGSVQNIVNYIVGGMRVLSVMPFMQAVGNYYFGHGDKAKTHVMHGVVAAVIVFGITGIIRTLTSQIQN